jgi:hypothetical protein
MILGDGTEVRMGNTYGQGEVGDERGSKEMDRCPLTIGELFHNTLSDETPLEPQLNTMLQLGYNLHSLGQQLNNSLIAITMMISLPDSYSTLDSILMATDLKQTSESIKTSVLQEETT